MSVFVLITWRLFITTLLIMVSLLMIQSMDDNNDESITDHMNHFYETQHDDHHHHHNIHTRYLLYDVNPGEGFSIRIHFFLRAAILVHNLNTMDTTSTHWRLVLPPWSPQMVHWFRRRPSTFIPWGEFFDIDVMRKVVDVLEYSEFLDVHPDGIDEALSLVSTIRYALIDKIEEVSCDSVSPEYIRFQRNNSTSYRKHLFSFHEFIYEGPLRCFNFFGGQDMLHSLFLKSSSISEASLSNRAELTELKYDTVKGDAVFIDCFEEVHWSGDWHSPIFWRLKEHLQYAPAIVSAADRFKKEHGIDSTPYLSAHLRRTDFIKAHAKVVPSLEEAIKLLKELSSQTGINKIFVATDGNDQEKRLLKDAIPDIIMYIPPSSEMFDGHIALVEQLICVGGSRFIGTARSFFTSAVKDFRRTMHGIEENSEFISSD